MKNSSGAACHECNHEPVLGSRGHCLLSQAAARDVENQQCSSRTAGAPPFVGKPVTRREATRKGALPSSRSDDALHHHDEHLASIPSADPAYPPAIDAITQTCGLSQMEEPSLDLQSLQSARRCRRGCFRWQYRGVAGDVHGISLSTDVNHDSGASLRHGRCAGGFARGERNDLLSHDLTPYLGLGRPVGPPPNPPSPSKSQRWRTGMYTGPATSRLWRERESHKTYS